MEPNYSNLRMFNGAGGGGALLAAGNVHLDEYGANGVKIKGLPCGKSCCVKFKGCCEVAAGEDVKTAFTESTNAGGT